jgi:uncharacterized protein with PIN domain
MLGRLARWLRLLGYDTLYAGKGSDHQVIACARAEGRVVLTRDRELARRRGARFLLIRSQDLAEQIAEVVSVYGAPGARRCSQCNAPLVRATPAQARDHVPPYVFQTQTEFRYCPTCDKYYWPGTHWDGVRQILEQLDLDAHSRSSDSRVS